MTDFLLPIAPAAALLLLAGCGSKQDPVEAANERVTRHVEEARLSIENSAFDLAESGLKAALKVDGATNHREAEMLLAEIEQIRQDMRLAPGRSPQDVIADRIAKREADRIAKREKYVSWREDRVRQSQKKVTRPTGKKARKTLWD